MNRRKFMQWLGFAPAAVALPALAKQNDFVGARTGRTTHYGDDGVKWPYGAYNESYKYYVTFGTGTYYNVGETVQINDHPHVEPANYLITDRWGLARHLPGRGETWGGRVWYEYDAVRVW